MLLCWMVGSPIFVLVSFFYLCFDAKNDEKSKVEMCKKKEREQKCEKCDELERMNEKRKKWYV